GQRRIASVLEVMSQGANRLVEDLGLGLVEFVEERFGVGDFRKLQSLFLQVLAVVLVNFGSRPADHQELENLLSGLASVFLHRAEINLAIPLSVESFEPAAKRA